MKVGCQIPVGRTLCQHYFQLPGSGAQFARTFHRGQKVSDHANPMPHLHRKARLCDQAVQCLDVEAAVPDCVGLPQDKCQRLVRSTANRARQHRGRLIGRQDTHPSAGAYTPGQRRCRASRLVDVLEDVVAEHEVGATLGYDIGQPITVTLNAPHGLRDPGRLRAPRKQRQSVGARVDDSHGVTAFGQGYGEPAGATSDIQDPQRPGAQEWFQSRPHR